MARRDSLLRPVISLVVRWRALDADLAARCDADLSIRDNALAGLQALLDHNLITVPLAQRHLALIDGHVLLDYVNIRSLSRHLRCRGRHQHRAANRIEYQTNIDE